MKNGSNAFITVWVFEVDQINVKCPMSCEYIVKPEKCQGHWNIKDTVLDELGKRAKYLINNVKHKNLVRYLALNIYLLQFLARTSVLQIEVSQDFVEGESIRSICENGQLVNVIAIGKEVLQSISYLHNKPTELLHGYLNEKSIFLDKSGVCRVSDFDLIPYLMYLKGVHKLHQENDFEAVGKLVGGLSEITWKSSCDFVDKCRSGLVIHHSDLLEHHFLSNNCYSNKKQKNNGLSIENFSIEEELGRGSFGVVLKAKQEIDKKSYAIKIVEMPENKNEYEKAAREAELISRINHKNVVRYITSWKQESVNLTEFRKQYGICCVDESMVSETVSEYDFH